MNFLFSLPIFTFNYFKGPLILLSSEVFKHIWWIAFQVWPQGNQILSTKLDDLTYNMKNWPSPNTKNMYYNCTTTYFYMFWGQN
jgi:hypothetical protein